MGTGNQLEGKSKPVDGVCNTAFRRKVAEFRLKPVLRTLVFALKGDLRCPAVLLTLLLFTPAFGNEVASQRVDGCVVMTASQANSNGDRLDWTFELKHSGSLTLQVISSLDDADASLPTPVTAIEVDGQPHDGVWKKAYLIEDGLVWECSQPVEFPENGIAYASDSVKRVAEIGSADSDGIREIQNSDQLKCLL